MSVVLRRARSDDSGLLFDWVNEPDSLAGKLLTKGPIMRSEHDAWFAARLADVDTFLWIIESGHRPIGQLRLMKMAGVHEVDIYVARTQRQAGIAQQALRLGIEVFRRDRPGRNTVRARVRTNNIASRRLFERAGFLLTGRNEDHLVYDLTTS